MIDVHSAGSLFTIILFLSIISQYIVQQIKNVLPVNLQNKLSAKNDTWFNSGIIALVVGVVLAFIAKADILAAIGIKSIAPVVDYLITGVLISGGSSLIHDVVSSISEIGGGNVHVENIQPAATVKEDTSVQATNGQGGTPGVGATTARRATGTESPSAILEAEHPTEVTTESVRSDK